MFATLTSKRGRECQQRSWRLGVRKSIGAALSSAALIAAVTCLDTGLTTGPASAGRDVACGAAAEMLTRGLDAYKTNRYEVAVPALECVLRKDDGLQKFHADFYLARIYSDSASGFVDHTRAYTLFQGLAESVETVDPDDVRRAPFVAKSLTAIAGYVRRGLPEIGLKPDLTRAVEILRHAATFLNEPDAQFELAKLHLSGDGVPVDVPLGLHYIQKLVQDSHAGAQAYLAELHQAGKHVRLDRTRALALAKLSVENATPSDRLWIEDGYQNIYCSTVAPERTRAAELANAFRRTFARGTGTSSMMPLGNQPSASAQPSAPMALGRREPTFSRTCSNGETIDMDLRGAQDLSTPFAPQGLSQGTSQAPPLASSLIQTMPQQTMPQQTMPAGMRSPAR